MTGAPDRKVYPAYAIVAALGIAALWVSSADAQEDAPKCGPTKEMFAELRKGGQTEVVVAPVSPQVIFMFLASPGGRDWTQVAMRVDGTTCILAKGKDFAAAPVTPEGRDA